MVPLVHDAEEQHLAHGEHADQRDAGARGDRARPRSRWRWPRPRRGPALRRRERLDDLDAARPGSTTTVLPISSSASFGVVVSEAVAASRTSA